MVRSWDLAEILIPDRLSIRILSGKLICKIVERTRINRGNLRGTARICSDKFLSDLGNQPSDYFGTFFRYELEWNKLVTGFLSRKEALFGEYGPQHSGLVHMPLVTFNVCDDIVEVTYRELTQADFEFLVLLLEKMKLEITN
jgi:hypothetical protein